MSDKIGFVLSDVEASPIDIIKSFEYKLGDNVFILQNNEFCFYTQKDITIKLNKQDKFYLNNILIENEEQILIKKGFNVFKIDALLWNQKENIENYNILEITEKTLSLQDKNSNEIFIKNINQDDSLFLKLFLKGDILFNEVKPKIYYENQKTYLERKNTNDIFIYFKYKNILVDTVQIKIVLKTLKQSNPVYVSTLTVRGV